MTDRKLFGTNQLVDDFVNQLELIETLNYGTHVRYIDKSTGQQWLKYSVDPDGSRFFNLIQWIPRLTTEQLIDVTFNSLYPDEVSAAAYRLYLEEDSEKKEYRKALLTRIQEAANGQLSILDKARLDTIIRSAGLINVLNQGEIVGKHYTEIEKDFISLKEVAAEARKILDKLYDYKH